MGLFSNKCATKIVQVLLYRSFYFFKLKRIVFRLRNVQWKIIRPLVHNFCNFNGFFRWTFRSPFQSNNCFFWFVDCALMQPIRLSNLPVDNALSRLMSPVYQLVSFQVISCVLFGLVSHVYQFIN